MRSRKTSTKLKHTDIDFDIKSRNEDRKECYVEDKTKENRKRQMADSNRYGGKFKLGELNSTLITSKRITVGIKGIFGNARTSSSVYRDIQSRLKNKKISNAVASEVELSLSRIVPTRNKSRYSDADSSRLTKSSTNDFLIPGSTSTPIETKRPVSGSIERSGSCSSSNSSISNSPGSVLKTPLPPQNSYVKIANNLRSAFPTLRIFKDIDYLGDIKKELKKYHTDKYSLKFTPVFRKEQSQPTPVLDEEAPPATKKLCHGEASSQHLFNSDIQKGPSYTPSNEVSPKEIIDRSSIQPRISNTKQVNVLDKISASTIDGKFRHHCAGIPYTNDDLRSEIFILEDINNRDVEGLDSGYFNDFLDLPNIKQIFRKPMSCLRAPRRSKAPPTDLTESTCSSKLDILDFIDSIPMDTLESRLLGVNLVQPRREENSSVITGVQTVPDTLALELHKPAYESPSPPKFYRMNMY